MKRVSFFFIIVGFLSLSFINGEAFSTKKMKERLPEWKMEVVRTYDSGQPWLIYYYEEDESGIWHPVKRLSFFETGVIQIEEDLVEIEKGEKAYERYNTQVVPHGLSVEYYPNSNKKLIIEFDRGLEDGLLEEYYSQGDIKNRETYEKGFIQGLATSYFEGGSKNEECHYEKGKLNGEVWSYYPSGKRKSLVSLKDDVKEGDAFEWYENGQVKKKVHHESGKEQNYASHPAVIGYDMYGAIIEVKHYEKGLPIGAHVLYYPSGQEKERIPYREGVIDGVCKWGNETGEIFGEGTFRLGKKVGTHWRKFDNGNMKLLEEYDSEGKLLSPIKEFYPSGKIHLQYFLENGKNEGSLREWYEHGTIKRDCSYHDGVLVGEEIIYHVNGSPFQCANYVEGKKQGLMQQWYENGVLSLKCTYSMDKLDGEFVEWYHSGEYKTRTCYKEGEVEGSYQSWFTNGMQKEVFNQQNGKKQGTHKIWDNSGELIFDCYYQEGLVEGVEAHYYGQDKPQMLIERTHGKRHGKTVEYYPTGEVKLKAFFQEDMPDGLVQKWFLGGKIQYQKFYKGGIPIGEQKEYYPSELLGDKERETLMKVTNYNSSGKLHGEQKSYYPNGKIKSILFFDNGELEGRKALFDEKNELTEECFYQKGRLEGKFYQRDAYGRSLVCHYHNNRKEGAYEIYYPSHPKWGNIKALEATYRAGKLEGEVFDFNETGAKIGISTYKEGKRNGVHILFNIEGLIILKMTYEEGKKSGDAICYYDNGRVQKVTPFVNDLIEGEEKVFFNDGKLSSITTYRKGKLNGVSQAWNQEGVLVFEGEYVDGKREGKFNKYYNSGKPRILQSFKNDMLVMKQEFDPEGNQIF